MLHPMLDGYNNASGYMPRGVVLTYSTAVPYTMHPRNIISQKITNSTADRPILRRTHFLADIISALIYWTSPIKTLIKSNVKLVGSVIQHACMAEFFNVCENITFSCMNNKSRLWVQQKGSDTSTSPWVHLIHLPDLHQQYHHYTRRSGIVCRKILERPWHIISTARTYLEHTLLH